MVVFAFFMIVVAPLTGRILVGVSEAGDSVVKRARSRATSVQYSDLRNPFTSVIRRRNFRYYDKELSLPGIGDNAWPQLNCSGRNVPAGLGSRSGLLRSRATKRIRSKLLRPRSPRTTPLRSRRLRDPWRGKNRAMLT